MSSGRAAELLHERRLILLNQLHESHQPVTIRQAGRQVEIDQRRDGPERFTVFFFVSDATRAHGLRPGGNAATVLSRSDRDLREIRIPPVEPVRPVPCINAVAAAIRVEQWQAPHPPPLPQFILQGLRHVRDPHGVQLTCIFDHGHDSLQNLTVVPGQRGVQAQREPQPPSFPFWPQKPVRPESVSAPAVLRHYRTSSASGQIQNMQHLIVLDAARQRQQLVVLLCAWCRVKSNQIKERLPGFAIVLAILDESRGHGSPPGKMLPVYWPAGRLLSKPPRRAVDPVRGVRGIHEIEILSAARGPTRARWRLTRLPRDRREIPLAQPRLPASDRQ